MVRAAEVCPAILLRRDRQPWPLPLECPVQLPGMNGMDCTVRWHEGMSFVAETGSGHLVCMDGAPEAGGRRYIFARRRAVFSDGGENPKCGDLPLFQSKTTHG